MKTTKIDVTKADLENGVEASSLRCPIALASKRAFAGVSDKKFKVSVGQYYLIVTFTSEDGTRFCFSMPKEATEFVDNFDSVATANALHTEKAFMKDAQERKAKCLPFSFSLDLPPDFPVKEEEKN